MGELQKKIDQVVAVLEEAVRDYAPVAFANSLGAEDMVLTDLIAKIDGLNDRALLLEMLTRREQLGSTGIGNGVAIPHGRSLAMADLKVVFARSDRGIPYDAIDGEPVHLFFLIVAPPQDPQNEYLPLLGRIADLIKDAPVRESLRKVQDFTDLQEVFREALGE